MTARRTIVIGIGNPDRGDDAAGRIVARQLQGALPDAIEITEHDGEAAGLLDRMAGAQRVFLIDACASSAPPGTVHRFDAAAAPLPQATFDLSTHGLGLAEAIELARALDQLPPHCIVYAIEAADVTAGGPLSSAVADAVDAVAGRLATEITTTPKPQARQNA